MEMQFGVGERLLVLMMLPARGSVLTMEVVSELKSALGFSEQEIEEYQLREKPTEDGKTEYKWDLTKPHLKAIVVGPTARAIITAPLQELHESEQVEEFHLPLMRMFEVGQ